MKAIVHHKHGTPGVLELYQIDKPVVADDELLVRIRASSLNIGLWPWECASPRTQGRARKFIL